MTWTLKFDILFLIVDYVDAQVKTNANMLQPTQHKCIYTITILVPVTDWAGQHVKFNLPSPTVCKDTVFFVHFAYDLNLMTLNLTIVCDKK